MKLNIIIGILNLIECCAEFIEAILNISIHYFIQPLKRSVAVTKQQYMNQEKNITTKENRE